MQSLNMTPAARGFSEGCELDGAANSHRSAACAHNSRGQTLCAVAQRPATAPAGLGQGVRGCTSPASRLGVRARRAGNCCAPGAGHVAAGRRQAAPDCPLDRRSRSARRGATSAGQLELGASFVFGARAAVARRALTEASWRASEREPLLLPRRRRLISSRSADFMSSSTALFTAAAADRKSGKASKFEFKCQRD